MKFICVLICFLLTSCAGLTAVLEDFLFLGVRASALEGMETRVAMSFGKQVGKKVLNYRRAGLAIRGTQVIIEDASKFFEVLEISTLKNGRYFAVIDGVEQLIAETVTEGIIFQGELLPIKPSTLQKVVEEGLTNVRSSPSMQGNKIHQLSKGRVVFMDRIQDDWKHVYIPQKGKDEFLQGWIKDNLIDGFKDILKEGIQDALSNSNNENKTVSPTSESYKPTTYNINSGVSNTTSNTLRSNNRNQHWGNSSASYNEIMNYDPVKGRADFQNKVQQSAEIARGWMVAPAPSKTEPDDSPIVGNFILTDPYSNGRTVTLRKKDFYGYTPENGQTDLKALSDKSKSYSNSIPITIKNIEFIGSRSGEYDKYYNLDNQGCPFIKKLRIKDSFISNDLYVSSCDNLIFFNKDKKKSLKMVNRFNTTIDGIKMLYSFKIPNSSPSVYFISDQWMVYSESASSYLIQVGSIVNQGF